MIAVSLTTKRKGTFVYKNSNNGYFTTNVLILDKKINRFLNMHTTNELPKSEVDIFLLKWSKSERKRSYLFFTNVRDRYDSESKQVIINNLKNKEKSKQ